MPDKKNAAVVFLEDPPSPLTLTKSLAKLQSVVGACDPRVVILSPDVNRLRLASKLNLLSSARRLWPDVPYQTRAPSRSSSKGRGSGGGEGSGASSRWFSFVGDGANAAGVPARCFDEQSLEEDDVAFLQFTSGSTSEPKGVMVTFANLLHNAQYISRKSRKVRGGPCGLRSALINLRAPSLAHNRWFIIWSGKESNIKQ